MMSISQVNALSGDSSNQRVRLRNIVCIEPVQNFRDQVENIQDADVDENNLTAPSTPRAPVDQSVTSKNLKSSKSDEYHNCSNAHTTNKFTNNDGPSAAAIEINQDGSLNDLALANAVMNDQTNNLNLTYDSFKDVLHDSALFSLQSSTSSNSVETLDFESLESLRDIELHIANNGYENEDKADELSVNEQSPDVLTMSAQTAVMLIRPHNDLKASGYYEIKNFNDGVNSPELLKIAHDATGKTQGLILAEELSTVDNFEFSFANEQDVEIDTDLLKRVRTLTPRIDLNQVALSTNRVIGAFNTPGQTSSLVMTESTSRPDHSSFVSNTLFLQEQNPSMKLNDYSKEFSSLINVTPDARTTFDNGDVLALNTIPLDTEANGDKTMDRPSFEPHTNHFQSMNDFTNMSKNSSTSSMDVSATFTKQLSMQHPETAEKISIQLLQVSGLHCDKPGKMTLQMTPESMGRVEVTFERSPDGRIDAVVNIHKADTYDLFRNDQQELRQAIADAFNVDQDGLNFNLNHQQQQTPPDNTFIIQNDNKTRNQHGDEYTSQEVVSAYPIDHNRVLDRRI